MSRLRERMQARAAERFVGREAELALIGESLAADPPPVSVFVVHGPGGVGKTTLLERARSTAAALGVDSLRLDARDVEPTPDGVLRALAAGLGLPLEAATLAQVAERFALAPRRLLVFDTFEHLAHLDGWLRASLLPELPEQTVVLVATRGAPDAAWTTDPLWREGARVVALGNLSRAEGRRYLEARGVAPEHCERLLDLTYAHPLALTLVADVAAATGTVPDALGNDVVRRLAERFTAQVPSDRHRRALELCALARVTTESLLADAVDAGRARELFDWLSGLSFVEAGAAGLFPHDLVRGAIDDELRWRNLERHREVRRAISRHLGGRVLADEREAPKLAFDILFLFRRAGALQRFVDFRALGSAFFERYRPEDAPALDRLLAAQLPPGQRVAFGRWRDHPAAAVWLARPAPGQVNGVTLAIDLAQLTPKERSADPVAARVWSALERELSPRPGDAHLLARWTLPEGGQRGLSAAMSALEMSQFFQWLTHPKLGTYTIYVEQPEHWVPMMDYMLFRRLPGPEMVIDGTAHGAYARDFRATPMVPWLLSITRSPEPAAGANATIAAAGPAAAASATGATGPPAFAVAPRLSRAAFERAVRDALRAYDDREALATNPLLGAACVLAACRAEEAPVAALRRALGEAAGSLRERPRDQKFWRALELTYLRPVGSQELAAERLGLPFGTYRYQLATGIERVADVLWRRELDAAG